MRTHAHTLGSQCGRSETQRHTAHVLGQKRDILLMSSATYTPQSRHAPLNTSAVASRVHGPVAAPTIILLPNGTHSLVFPGQYVLFPVWLSVIKSSQPLQRSNDRQCSIKRAPHAT